MKNNFVNLMFTLKIDKQSIPIWFRCDKTKSNRHHEIDELFCIRAKVNSNIKIYIYDKKEKHKIYKNFTDFKVWKNKSLYYENLYSLVCFAGLWLTIIGIDYTKNYIHVKKNLNIRYVKKNKNNKPIRIMSLFNLGLTIFRRCYNSYINYKIKTNMQLYL